MSPAPVATALVLAGGAGTRLLPCVSDRPKALAEVDGRPFLDYLLEQLRAAGITRVVPCTGHLGEQIEREYGGDYGGMELVYSRESKPLGTAGALRAALPFVAGEYVLVLNGDSFCDVRLAQFLEWARTNAAPAALVAVEVADTGRFGALRLADDTRVASFEEKIEGRGSGLINAGIYCFHRRVLERLGPHTPLSLERDVLPMLAISGLLAWRTEASFLDIGTPESFTAAQSFFASRAQRGGGERRGLLVLDRDGTLIAERHYLADPAGVELLPGVVDGLRRFRARGYELAIVTNQSGIGRGLFDELALAAVHAELLAQLRRAGIPVHGIWHCPHRPEDGCACRKPQPGLLEAALRTLGYAASECLVVGDKASDIDLGQRAGARTALVRTGYGRDTERAGGCTPDLIADGLDQLALQEIGA